jgi:hypothetical protein
VTPDADTRAHLAQCSPDLLRRLEALIVACPRRIGITSSWRSRERQQELYDGWKARKPGYNPANPPGTSRHEDTDRQGRPAANAADINGDKPWAHTNAERFGLHFNIAREDWHIEPNGRPFTPEEDDIVASIEELRAVVRDEINRLSGGPRRRDGEGRVVDGDPQTISVADVYTLVEQLAARPCTCKP